MQPKMLFHRLMLKNKNFSIISNNCWSGFVYRYLDIPNQSPFLWEIIFSPDYIRLLQDLRNSVKDKLRFIDYEKSKYLNNQGFSVVADWRYPIGVIGDDVELHFIHHTDEDKSSIAEKWEKRVKRINYDNMIVKFSENYLCTDELIREFDRLPFENKICFTTKPFPELKSVMFLKEYAGQPIVQGEWSVYKRHLSVSKFFNSLIQTKT